MARLSKNQEQARREVVALSRCRLPLDSLGQGIVNALSQAIPNDGYRLLGIDPSTLLVNRIIAASDNDGWARSEWLREVYLRSGNMFYVELHEMMRLGLTAVAVHEQQDYCWGFPREVLERLEPEGHREAFHDLRSPVGGILIGCFGSRGRWVAALQLYRRDTERPFRRTDVAFMRMMSPAIGEALMRAIHQTPMHDASNGSAAPETSGIIILDRDGRPSFETPAGESWRRALGDPNDHLPGAILAAAAKARATGDYGVVLANTVHGPARVEVSRAGQDGEMAVVITPQRVESPPPVPLAWDLTPAEQRVAELALRGLENAAIAARLFVSEETVRTHLGHLYEKLNIRGRNQLMACYFAASFADVDLGK